MDSQDMEATLMPTDRQKNKDVVSVCVCVYVCVYCA